MMMSRLKAFRVEAHQGARPTTMAMADDARPVDGPAQLEREVADDPGRLDLVGAPEGFDALVDGRHRQGPQGPVGVRRPRRRARCRPSSTPSRFFAPDVEVLTLPVLGLPALRPRSARRRASPPSG